jgi:hypothetical protein
MSSVSGIIFPQNIGQNPRELLGLVGLPSDADTAPKQLSASTHDMVRSVVSVVDAMILRTIKDRTREDFEKTRTEVFPQYFAAMAALSMLVRVTVDDKDLTWLAAQSLSELEADFRDHGAAAFGTAIRDRGVFTVWILRKVASFIPDISKAPALDGEQQKKDNELAMQFVTHAAWARFHIDCLINSMHSKVPIFPDVMPSIEDGLRAAVNAYALIRQAVDLRVGNPEPNYPNVPWDEEDASFVADSMRDLAREEP